MKWAVVAYYPDNELSGGSGEVLQSMAMLCEAGELAVDDLELDVAVQTRVEVGEGDGLLELGAPFLFVIEGDEDSVCGGVYPDPVVEEVNRSPSRAACFDLGR